MECKCIKPLACKLRVVYRAMLPESSSASARPRPPFVRKSAVRLRGYPSAGGGESAMVAQIDPFQEGRFA